MATALVRAALTALLAVSFATACAGSRAHDVRADARPRLPVQFVPAPAKLMRQCRATARLVGYAVPCPTRIPRGLGIAGVVSSHPSGSWKGWVTGSSEVAWPREHLVISASPRPIRDYAKIVNGPAWYPRARVEVGASLTMRGLRVCWVFVPPRTNDGSAFAGHVVLVWTEGGHTYAVGFHDTSTRAETRAMDLELVRHLRLVGP